ncbi:hypothetical protein RRF57_010229 [Xylaria bambusicola]|uniref:Uncharacterized protein n=1 Tax=Xylaria bambusicola TaxID=326684 RepID=A0AAN7UWX5_9PEZI
MYASAEGTVKDNGGGRTKGSRYTKVKGLCKRFLATIDVAGTTARYGPLETRAHTNERTDPWRGPKEGKEWKEMKPQTHTPDVYHSRPVLAVPL